jgi:hypothetical protein
VSDIPDARKYPLTVRRNADRETPETVVDVAVILELIRTPEGVERAVEIAESKSMNSYKDLGLRRSAGSGVRVSDPETFRLLNFLDRASLAGMCGARYLSTPENAQAFVYRVLSARDAFSDELDAELGIDLDTVIGPILEREEVGYPPITDPEELHLLWRVTWTLGKLPTAEVWVELYRLFCDPDMRQLPLELLYTLCGGD